MGKFKIGDKVLIKETGNIGIVKGREIINESDNRVKIEYVVKLDDGFSNWNVYNKNELEKVKNDKPKKKINKLVVSTAKGHVVTLAAFTDTYYIDCWNLMRGGCRKGKELRIGYSICNPNDSYDENFGVKLALHRAKNSPFCHLISDFSGEFNKETIEAILQIKAEYIVNNIEHFVKD